MVMGVGGKQHMLYKTHQKTRNTPLGANYQAGHVDNGKSAIAGRYVWGNIPKTISSRPSQSHHFRCVCPPCFGEIWLIKSFQGGCYR